MQVPFIDLSRRAASFGSDLDSIAHDVLSSGVWLLGPELEAFESAFAKYCGASQCAGVGSGTDALRLSLRAMGVGEGDEVLVPAMTAVPTAAAVCATGATPVFVDVMPDTALIDPADAGFQTRGCGRWSLTE